ncbi:MAG TPA: glycosyltransferase WbuB [Spongiibacteraceae bacterium]|nr:glycosyltransferase WbuB [Spongiibacteraceae bacterium]HCS28277.1 glycosyltransferase WbuB [Spongiibacteraceae bacterium]
MIVTILTQYYPPETGAPQNRLHGLAKALVAQGVEVKIVTAMPNYPVGKVHEAYRRRAFCRELFEGVPIWRSWIYASNSRRILPRLINYFSFVFTGFFSGLRSGKCDVLICESPPLFLGLSAVLLSWLKGARLVFNVSDLWPESAEKLGIVGNGFFLRLAYRLEAWLYRRSWLVSGQTQGIVDDIVARFPDVRTHWLPNGVDADFYKAIEPSIDFCREKGLVGKKLFVYAGVLGHAQGLEVMINAADRLKDDNRLAFVVIGDGPKKEELETLNRRLGGNVHFLPHMSRYDVMGVVAASYACVVPLRKLPLFEGAIPSKIFDPLALGVPVLLGVRGEAEELFVTRGQAGLAFEPEDDADLARQVTTLLNDETLRSELADSGKQFVYQYFDRRAISADFLAAISSDD